MVYRRIVHGGELPAELFRMAVDQSPDGCILFDEAGVVVYANGACATVLGWTPEELIGQNLGKLVHPDDLEVAIKSVIAITDQGVRSRPQTVMRYQRPDGTYLPVEINGNPLVVDGKTLQSLFIRRAEDHRLIHEAIEQLAAGSELDELVALVRAQLLWRRDVQDASLVLVDADGVRRDSTATLPAGLTGLDTLAPSSPWGAAWRGEPAQGHVDALPAELAADARRLDLSAFRVEPVEVDGQVRAVLTLWEHPSTEPLPDIELRLRALKRLLTVMIQFTEQQDRLVHQAGHDALTGLANRRRFYEHLLAASTRPRATTTAAAVLYIDLDGFKPVNDRFGHAAGDILLADVARRLEASCREGDLVARLGGDEFAVLCQSCTPADAAAIAERFLTSLQGPIDIGGQFVDVGASIGLATGFEADGELLTLRADDALYQAKRTGGRQLVVD
jgi:diguanylate cyclase (GGDEF)-like protein/PAS domain S-box-containing protein